MKKENNTFMVINRNNSKELSIESLILENYSKSVHYYTCEKCLKYHAKIECNETFIFEKNSFLAIQLNNVENRRTFLRTKIIKFDHTRFSIPNSSAKSIFKLKSAIVFELSNYNNALKGGHYICWQRVSKGCVKISDNRGIYSINFLEDLIGVCLLIFDKTE